MSQGDLEDSVCHGELALGENFSVQVQEFEGTEVPSKHRKFLVVMKRDPGYEKTFWHKKHVNSTSVLISNDKGNCWYTRRGPIQLRKCDSSDENQLFQVNEVSGGLLVQKVLKNMCLLTGCFFQKCRKKFRK